MRFSGRAQEGRSLMSETSETAEAADSSEDEGCQVSQQSNCLSCGSELSYRLLGLADKQNCKDALREANKGIEAIRKQIQIARGKLERQQHQEEEQSWQELVHILEGLKDAWEIEPDQFVMNVTVLGYRAKEYLDLLSICLDSSEFWKQKSENTVGQGTEAVVLTRDLTDFENNHPFDRLGGGRKWCQCHMYYMNNVTSASRKYVTHWTTMEALIAPQKVGDMIFIAKALHNCGNYSDCYNSVVSRNILDQYWDQVFIGYMIRISIDILFLLSIGLNIRQIIYTPSHKPSYWLSKVSGIFAIRAALNPVFDLLAVCCHYGFRMGIVQYTDFWLIINALAEIGIGLTVGSELLKNDANNPCDFTKEHDYKDPCFFIRHPARIMVAVGLTWIHLTLDLMNVKFFGMSVLPAFYAITGSEAGKFMAFLCLILLGSFQAYWCLPIPDNQPRAHFSHLTNSFEKIYKLNILGDFDNHDLEGVNQLILRPNGTNGTWILEDGPESPTYHDGIRLLSLFLASFVAVGVMNMSIGVLGHAYEENKKKHNQIYYHFLSGTVYKLLLRQKYLCCCCPRRCGAQQERAGGSRYRTKGQDVEQGYSELKGYLVRFHEETCWDEEDASLHVLKMANKVDRLQKIMEEMESKLENPPVKLTPRQETSSFHHLRH